MRILPKKKVRNRNIRSDSRQKRDGHQSNVPPQIAMCPHPWVPWVTLYTTGGEPAQSFSSLLLNIIRMNGEENLEQITKADFTFLLGSS